MEAREGEEPARKGPDSDEVLDVGQEEVFSRTEVELGRIEHHSDAGRESPCDRARKD